jgi:hypothetical protein
MAVASSYTTPAVYYTGDVCGAMVAYNALRQSSSVGISSTNWTDGFVMRYDISGTPEWVVRIGGAAAGDAGRSIIADTSGLYVGGQFGVLSMPLIFYNADGTNSGVSLTPSGNIDVFIARYTRAGVAEWAAKIVATGAESIGTITAN